MLALPDIPEVDSRRLSELCRILNALEGLFVDTDGAAAGFEADSVRAHLTILAIDCSNNITLLYDSVEFTTLNSTYVFSAIASAAASCW